MTDNRLLKLCIVTSTRADWGLLSPLAAELRRRPGVQLQIVATNMHLMERYGHTVDEIIADGFTVDARVPLDIADDSEASRARAMATCAAGMTDAFSSLAPDAVIILGDRYEMLSVASVAAVMRLPIVHISGGEVTLGAVDDCLRHAITKLSTLHLTATEVYRRRVIQMGEQPTAVVNCGALGVWNAMHQPLPTEAALRAELGIEPNAPLAVVTYHSVTLDDESPAVRMQAMLNALDRFPDLHCIITYPNNDARSQQLIDMLQRYAEVHSDRVTLVKSLGMRRYLAAVKAARVVIGNSSSGVVEVPSTGTPTVDIGPRQLGRVAAASVVHCDDGVDNIAAAIARALSDEHQRLSAGCDNPYAREDTPTVMADAILRFMADRPITPKKFYDLTYTTENI